MLFHNISAAAAVVLRLFLLYYFARGDGPMGISISQFTCNSQYLALLDKAVFAITMSEQSVKNNALDPALIGLSLVYLLGKLGNAEAMSQKYCSRLS